MRSFALAAMLCSLLTGAVACSGGDDGGGEAVTGLYLFDLNTGQLEHVTDDPAFHVAWTADGATVWYATAFAPGGDGEVRAFDVAAGETRDILSLDGGGFVSLAPAAAYVAFISDLDGTYRPTLRTPDGGFVTYDEGLGVQVRPDGAYLLYASPPCAPSQSVHIVDVASADEFVTEPGAFAATWLPDGRISMSVQSAGDPGLPATQVILDPTTRASVNAPEVLGTNPAGAYYLSPDGQHVLYGGNTNRILLKKTGEGAENEIGNGRVSLAAWSPDSSLIAYGALTTLHIAEPNGTERYAVDLTPLTEADGASPVALRWSPDGTKLAIGVGAVGESGVCGAAPTPTVVP